MTNSLLSERHLEQLRASAISPEVISERGYRTILDKRELEKLGFSKNQLRVPGLLIPQWKVNGVQTNNQFRPDHPRSNGNRKVIKYENPTGSVILLDCPPRCQKMVADPSIPLWITEGSKKADALASLGVCTISLTGVWGFKGKNEFGSVTMLADWDYIVLKNRDIYLAFDSDIVDKPSVKKALKRLAMHLVNKDANVKIVRLPSSNGAKVGIDDYLAEGHSLAEIHQLTERYKAEIEEQRINRPYFYFSNSLYLQVKMLDGKIAFAYLDGSNIKFTEEVSIGNGRSVIPQSLPKGEDGFELDLIGLPDEGIKTKPVLTPNELLKQIKVHVSKYVDLTMLDLQLCCYFALFSWFYQKVNTLGYLRFIGDTGKGKSRAQRVVGDLCFYPFRTCGASSFSGMARTSQKWKGTLIMDEADLIGDMANQVVKFLNLGFERGQYYVLSDKQNPRIQQFFDPFMPKVLAMRKPFHDNATEGRLLSIETYETNNMNIPVLLPKCYQLEVQDLRNSIARFVLEHWNVINVDWLSTFSHLSIEPRLKQLAMPLSIIFQLYPEGLKEFETYLLARQKEIRQTRSMSWEGILFNIVLSIVNGDLDLHEQYPDFYQDGKPLAVTPTMLSKQLNSTPKAVTQGLISIGFVVESRRIGSGSKKPRLYVVPNSRKWSELVSRYYYSEDDDLLESTPEILRSNKYVVCSEAPHVSHPSPESDENANSEDLGTHGTHGTVEGTRQENDIPDFPGRPCYTCGSTDFWLTDWNQWLCSCCHPKPSGGNVK